jgi:hypothetical protein
MSEMHRLADIGLLACHEKVKPPNTKLLGPTHDVLVAAQYGKTALLVGSSEQQTR